MDITLNHTPIRTSRNYRINDMTLKNVKIPTKFDLSHSKISYTTSSSKDFILDVEKSDEVENEFASDEIDTNVESFMLNQLTYGNGEFCENQINENSNFEKFIQINSIMPSEIFLDFDISKNDSLIESLFINAEEKTKGTVFFLLKGEGYHNGIIKINLKKGANISFFFINLLAGNNNFIAIESNLGDESKLDFTIIDLGAQNSISNYYTNLVGAKTQSNLNTIYIGKNDEVVDMNYIAHINKPESKVNFEVQGALKDSANKHFKGTIDFKAGCKKSIGEENEFCTLLSDKAKAISLPNLLCTEEDVEGAHSTAAGKPGSKELFYLLSRGFTRKEAEKLLVKARFNNILEGVKNDNIRNMIINKIDLLLD